MSISTPKVFENFDRSFQEMREATPLTRKDKATKLISQADLLALTQDGLEYLYENALALEEAGVFEGTVWQEPDKLVPYLVKGTLKAGHPTSSFEILSELRMLAYAQSNIANGRILAQEASDFVSEVVMLNLEFALREPSEESRNQMTERELKKAFGVFTFLLSKVDLEDIQDKLAEEIRLICAQRPIVTRKVREILQLLHDEGMELHTKSGKLLQFYLDAVYTPTEATKKNPGPVEYLHFLEKAKKSQLMEEAKQMGHLMEETGLVSKYHAVLLAYVIKAAPEAVPSAMSLSDIGHAEWEKHHTLIKSLVEETIHIENCQCIFGLSRMLETSMFSRSAVSTALENLRKIRLNPHVERRILKSIVNPSPQVTALQYLLGATFRVLGQPIGVGQGNNPTCQSARGISMWSQHAPAKLLNMIITAATQNNLIFRFEGADLVSSELGKGLLDKLDYNLDAVSVTLVPHLDKIYNEMMKRASMRGEDPHKWVNPAMYGQWIQVGFASAYHYLSNSIMDYQGFIRRFYAAFHPHHNGHHHMVYPNPVGIYVTSSKGDMVGFHAVSLLRVDENEHGEVRAYFLNPNNEGRQNWGQDITPSVYGHGERHGESSLPFHEFAARVYAFHYNYLETQQHLSDVPDEPIMKVEQMAKESWGRSYNWIQQAKTW